MHTHTNTHKHTCTCAHTAVLPMLSDGIADKVLVDPSVDGSLDNVFSSSGSLHYSKTLPQKISHVVGEYIVLPLPGYSGGYGNRRRGGCIGWCWCL